MGGSSISTRKYHHLQLMHGTEIETSRHSRHWISRIWYSVASFIGLTFHAFEKKIAIQATTVMNKFVYRILLSLWKKNIFIGWLYLENYCFLVSHNILSYSTSKIVWIKFCCSPPMHLVLRVCLRMRKYVSHSIQNVSYLSFSRVKHSRIFYFSASLGNGCTRMSQHILVCGWFLRIKFN